MKILQTHIVPDGTPRARLSDYACTIFSLIPSRKGIKKAILRNEILINNEIANTGDWVEGGQTITWIDLEKTPSKIFQLKLDVVFEDEFFAIINKPPGIVVSGNQFRTIENALLFNLKKSNELDALSKMRAVHRLDSPTSGLLMIAKTAGAHLHFSQLFEKKKIQKKYQAIVIGKLEGEGTIDFFIDKKEASTFYESKTIVPSLKNKFLTLVDLFPKTGRTHQLRIHLSKLGFPILGDDLYGKEGLILKHKGLFLCAVELNFTHPNIKEEMTIKIDTPKKFDTLMQREARRWAKWNA